MATKPLAHQLTIEVKKLLTGLNHLTLAVTDVNRSVAFYQGLLQLRLEAIWDSGAYLSLPGLWLCLSLDRLRNSEPAADYTHYAFNINANRLPALRRTPAIDQRAGMARQPQ